jgi:hypothetical protein
LIIDKLNVFPNLLGRTNRKALNAELCISLIN